MKVIVSHDVDHITVSEHAGDLIVPKFLVRNFIELGLGQISGREIALRFKSIISNKWQNLEELLGFNRENGVPATFFFALANGKGIAYSQQQAQFWMRKLIEEKIDVGVHGISYDNSKGIESEHDCFKRMSRLQDFGIRMHYLRRNENTLTFLSAAGYSFDSTIFEMTAPYRIGDIWEFPLQIMDAYILCTNNRWQDQTLEQTKERTQRLFDQAFEKQIGYLSVLLHDVYFTDAFRTWKEWYIWLIDYINKNGFAMVNYREAILELESQEANKQRAPSSYPTTNLVS